jgi:hypothetical protein
VAAWRSGVHPGAGRHHLIPLKAHPRTRAACILTLLPHTCPPALDQSGRTMAFDSEEQFLGLTYCTACHKVVDEMLNKRIVGKLELDGEELGQTEEAVTELLEGSCRRMKHHDTEYFPAGCARFIDDHMDALTEASQSRRRGQRANHTTS